MNVPFSHPSELNPQKDGRKVRSRDELPLTLGGGAHLTPPAPSDPGAFHGPAARLRRDDHGDSRAPAAGPPPDLQDSPGPQDRHPPTSPHRPTPPGSQSPRRTCVPLGPTSIGLRPFSPGGAGGDSAESARQPYSPAGRRRPSRHPAGVLNRSRCGTEPISARNTTDLGEWAGAGRRPRSSLLAEAAY